MLTFAQNPVPDKPKGQLYNTAKQKLLKGKQVFSFTQSKADSPEYEALMKKVHDDVL